MRIARGWYAPARRRPACSPAARFALIGFPLDDVWHRLFGQDVTLWGPTHLMLIGGAALTLVGQAVLLVEGCARRAASGRARAPTAAPAPHVRLRRARSPAAFLIGLSTFQAEFDFGVPQFQPPLPADADRARRRASRSSSRASGSAAAARSARSRSSS